jgi:hypothetical protein
MWTLLATAVAADLTGVTALYRWGRATCGVRADGDRCWTTDDPATPRTDGTGGVPAPPFATREVAIVGDGFCVRAGAATACRGADWRYPAGAAPGTPTDEWVDASGLDVPDGIFTAPADTVGADVGTCRVEAGRVTCDAPTADRLDDRGDLWLTRAPVRPAREDGTCVLEGDRLTCPPLRPPMGPWTVEGVRRYVEVAGVVCVVADAVRCRSGAQAPLEAWPTTSLPGAVDVALSPTGARAVALTGNGEVWELERSWVRRFDAPGAARVAVADGLICAWGAGEARCRGADGRSAVFAAEAPGATSSVGAVVFGDSGVARADRQVRGTFRVKVAP